jgi:hypothetical protein
MDRLRFERIGNAGDLRAAVLCRAPVVNGKRKKSTDYEWRRVATAVATGWPGAVLFEPGQSSDGRGGEVRNRVREWQPAAAVSGSWHTAL